MLKTHTLLYIYPPNYLSSPGKYMPWFFLSNKNKQQEYLLVGYVITNGSICAKFCN